MRLFLLFELFISIILFLFPPATFSLAYCYICFALFTGAFVILYNQKCSNNIVCFEFIFSIAYFFTNYVYPLFYYPINPYFSLFLLDFPEQYINDGCALCTAGYIIFCLGSLSKRTERSTVDKYKVNHRFKSARLYVPLVIVLLLLLIVSLFSILISGEYNGTWGEGTFYKVLADVFIFYLIFEKMSNSRSLRDVFSTAPILMILILIYIVEITIIGNRGLLLRVAFLSVFLYICFYKQIRKSIVFVSIVIGMFVMSYVGSMRGGGTFDGFNNDDVPVIIQMGQDLTINNRSLYVLMEQYEHNGPNFGKTWLMNLLSIIPFAQSTFLKSTGMDLSEINSASLVTDLHFRGIKDDVIGLGTNLVGDIYLTSGLFGVLFFMFLLGRIVAITYNRGMRGDMRYLFIYALIFMDCIILTRSTYLTSIRPITWGMVLYLLPRIK